jgi:hypothetical protein
MGRTRKAGSQKQAEGNFDAEARLEGVGAGARGGRPEGGHLSVTVEAAARAFQAASKGGAVAKSSRQDARPSTLRYWDFSSNDRRTTKDEGTGGGASHGIAFEGTRTYRNGILEPVGPGFYIHKNGFSDHFTAKEWEAWVRPLSEAVETDLRYGNDRVYTVAAQDGTRLYYVRYETSREVSYQLLSWKQLSENVHEGPDAPRFSTSSYFFDPRDPSSPPGRPLVTRDRPLEPRRFAHDDAWNDYFAYLGGNHVISPGRPPATVFGLPAEKMGPAYKTADGEVTPIFADAQWKTLVHPDQAALPTRYTYGPEGFLGSNKVYTVTARDGSQLYYREVEMPFFGGHFFHLVSFDSLTGSRGQSS